MTDHLPSLAERRAATGRLAEAEVAKNLAAAGYEVVNLNELAGNCPFADLIAHQADQRLLIQVKGTVTPEGKFGTRPDRVKNLAAIAGALGCESIYAFVHLAPALPVIRYATAAEVAELAEAAEAAYPGINRYHVTIDQVHVDDVRQVLQGPSM